MSASPETCIPHKCQQATAPDTVSIPFGWALQNFPSHPCVWRAAQPTALIGHLSSWPPAGTSSCAFGGVPGRISTPSEDFGQHKFLKRSQSYSSLPTTRLIAPRNRGLKNKRTHSSTRLSCKQILAKGKKKISKVALLLVSPSACSSILNRSNKRFCHGSCPKSCCLKRNHGYKIQ